MASSITDVVQALTAAFPWVTGFALVALVFVQMSRIINKLVDVLGEALGRHIASPGAVPAVPSLPSSPPALIPPPKPAAAPPVAPAPTVPPPVKPATEYDKMWAAMQILPQHQAVIEHDAGKILTSKATYEIVAQQTGVPWCVIGLIDQMEAGGGCKAHLHNGDPLEHRTIHVPEGRPPAPAEPPFTWEQSALDALKYEGFDKIKGWSIAVVAGALEKYNGMGYHMRGAPSPYLWSFSNQYTSGKFVKDHEYDPHAVSEQAGAMPILKALMALDPSITF
jgi:lysozyme family protein